MGDFSHEIAGKVVLHGLWRGSLDAKSIDYGEWVDEDHLRDLLLDVFVVVDLLPVAEPLIVVHVDVLIVGIVVLILP